jgi:FixJ family two-component response regulator
MSLPTVHLVDDDPSLLRALSRLLAAAGYAVRTFASATDFLAGDAAEYRGCVVADLQMPDMSGLELQAELADGGNPLPVIFLTGHGDISSCVDAMKHGAEDYLTKPVNKQQLVAAVEKALAHDAAACQQNARRRQLQRHLDLLTPREREVLLHVIGGKLNKEIASDLGAAERTIKAHRASIMAKLQAHSPAELGSLAREAGLVG